MARKFYLNDWKEQFSVCFLAIKEFFITRIFNNIKASVWGAKLDVRSPHKKLTYAEQLCRLSIKFGFNNIATVIYRNSKKDGKKDEKLVEWATEYCNSSVLRKVINLKKNKGGDLKRFCTLIIESVPEHFKPNGELIKDIVTHGDLSNIKSIEKILKIIDCKDCKNIPLFKEVLKILKDSNNVIRSRPEDAWLISTAAEFIAKNMSLSFFQGLNEKRSDLLAIKCFNDSKPLICYFTECGRVDVLGQCVELKVTDSGAQKECLDLRDFHGRGIAYFAAKSGQLEVLEWILNNKKDFFLNHTGSSTNIFAIACHEQFPLPSLIWMLENFNNNDNLKKIISGAAQVQRRTEVAEKYIQNDLLVKFYADFHEENSDQNRNLISAVKALEFLTSRMLSGDTGYILSAVLQLDARIIEVFTDNWFLGKYILMLTDVNQKVTEQYLEFLRDNYTHQLIDRRTGETIVHVAASVGNIDFLSFIARSETRWGNHMGYNIAINNVFHLQANKPENDKNATYGYNICKIAIALRKGDLFNWIIDNCPKCFSDIITDQSLRFEDLNFDNLSKLLNEKEERCKLLQDKCRDFYEAFLTKKNGYNQNLESKSNRSLKKSGQSSDCSRSILANKDAEKKGGSETDQNSTYSLRNARQSPKKKNGESCVQGSNKKSRTSVSDSIHKNNGEEKTVTPLGAEGHLSEVKDQTVRESNNSHSQRKKPKKGVLAGKKESVIEPGSHFFTEGEDGKFCCEDIDLEAIAWCTVTKKHSKTHNDPRKKDDNSPSSTLQKIATSFAIGADALTPRGMGPIF